MFRSGAPKTISFLLIVFYVLTSSTVAGSQTLEGVREFCRKLDQLLAASSEQFAGVRGKQKSEDTWVGLVTLGPAKKCSATHSPDEEYYVAGYDCLTDYIFDQRSAQELLLKIAKNTAACLKGAKGRWFARESQPERPDGAWEQIEYDDPITNTQVTLVSVRDHQTAKFRLEISIWINRWLSSAD